MPRLIAYAAFRFEVNVRATAMVGFVGAGGLGNQIHTAISLFHTRDLATLLMVLLGTVVAIDILGRVIRRRLIRVQ
jgi:phosphonate transport system permease protein